MSSSVMKVTVMYIRGDSLLFSGFNILSLEDFKALVVCEHF